MHTWIFQLLIDDLYILSFDFLAFSVFLSVLLVLTLLYFYIPWYIDIEPNKFQFYILIMIFSSSILFLSLINFGLLFLFFWEVLRISSYLLVSWWKRRDLANSYALVRLLSSRIGDVCLFLVISTWNFFERFLFSFFFLIAFSSKSAQFVFFPWLLGAMERPRPVSALLHSSTLVLARVILAYRLKEINIIISIRLLISRSLRFLLRVIRTSIFTDLKKRVACSTVYNVRFIFIWIYLSEYDLLSIHIIFHAVIKASTFVLLRIASHLLNIQDIRSFLRYRHKNTTLLFIFLLAFLSIIPIVRVITFKETRIELIIDNRLNISIYYRLFIISFVRFMFFIEYMFILPRQIFSNVKFVTIPSYTHVYLLISLPFTIIIFININITTIRNSDLFISYLLLLRLAVCLSIVVYRRSYFLDLQYVRKYNSIFIGNINNFKLQIIRIEFFLNINFLKKTEWFIVKNWRHNSIISSRIMFVTILFMILLLIL